MESELFSFEESFSVIAWLKMIDIKGDRHKLFTPNAKHGRYTNDFGILNTHVSQHCMFLKFLNFEKLLNSLQN